MDLRGTGYCVSRGYARSNGGDVRVKKREETKEDKEQKGEWNERERNDEEIVRVRIEKRRKEEMEEESKQSAREMEEV